VRNLGNFTSFALGYFYKDGTRVKPAQQRIQRQIVKKYYEELEELVKMKNDCCLRMLILFARYMIPIQEA
jgi:hypothetical protein